MAIDAASNPDAQMDPAKRAETAPSGASTPPEPLDDSSQLEKAAAEYERLTRRADRTDHLGTVRRFEAARVAHKAAEAEGKATDVVAALVARTGRKQSWIYEELRLARVYTLDDVKNLGHKWTHLQAVITPVKKLRGIKSLRGNEGMVREEALKWLKDESLVTVQDIKKAIEHEDEKRFQATQPDPDPDALAEAERQEAIERLAELLKEAQPLAKALVGDEYTDEDRRHLRSLTPSGCIFELSNALNGLCGETARELGEHGTK